jgi:hypothetical protein
MRHVFGVSCVSWSRSWGSSGPPAMHARGLLGRPRESNLTSVFHSATRLGSVTSWEASDATHLSTQRLHASISHHYHLRQRSNHRKAFPILHAHCDPSPPSLEVKEQPSANIEEKEQHHNHVRAPARARACKANECRKWTTQRRFTTTQRHASTRRSSAARCLRAAVPAELEPDCGYSSFSYHHVVCYCGACTITKSESALLQLVLDVAFGERKLSLAIFLTCASFHLVRRSALILHAHYHYISTTTFFLYCDRFPASRVLLCTLASNVTTVKYERIVAQPGPCGEFQ